MFEAGYAGLFVASFLGATLLPLSSEALLLLMLTQGYHPLGLLLVATGGEYLGSLTNYLIGRYGIHRLIDRWFAVRPERLHQAHRLYERWGRPMLFFSWLPVFGEALIMAAGALGVPVLVFTLWAVSGRTVRNIVVMSFYYFLA